MGTDYQSLPNAVCALPVAKLLPTPTVQATKHSNDDRGPGTPDDANPWSVIAREQLWGDYAAAITHQEQAFGRPAPEPTEPAPKGGRRLSCRFDEWMMGLPDGWVTDVPGVTHNEALKACGNGVVPQQAAAALRWLLRSRFGNDPAPTLDVVTSRGGG